MIINKTKILIYTLLFILFITGLYIPRYAFAASIHASANSEVFSGDTGIIEIFLDTEGETVNSIDGSIVLSDEHNGNFEVKDLSTVGSVFSLWPRKPSLEESNKIYFVGGIPGGVKGDRLLLFKVVVKINDEGKFLVKPGKIVVYKNDGLGTEISITKDSSSISVGSPNKTPTDRWKEVISNDNIAPEPFSISLIQDVNLFDGKKFVSFETNDRESGISYYEVKEGNYPVVRTGTTYVLIDQDKNVDVTVTAYDKAGNFQISILKEKEGIHWVSIIVSVLVIVLVYKIIKRIRKNKKRNVQ
jgi:hypothetical protein